MTDRPEYLEVERDVNVYFSRTAAIEIGRNTRMADHVPFCIGLDPQTDRILAFTEMVASTQDLKTAPADAQNIHSGEFVLLVDVMGAVAPDGKIYAYHHGDFHPTFESFAERVENQQDIAGLVVRINQAIPKPPEDQRGQGERQQRQRHRQGGYGPAPSFG